MIDRDWILVEFAFDDDIEYVSGHAALTILQEQKKLSILSATFLSSIISTKMDPKEATILKLTSPFLAERMRVSYIDDELKNKYRRK